jgi:hypothetical protein
VTGFHVAHIRDRPASVGIKQLAGDFGAPVDSISMGGVMTSQFNRSRWLTGWISMTVIGTLALGTAPAFSLEIVYAPFSQTGGVATDGTYDGIVSVTVSGAGQALANLYSDAFYLLPNIGGSPAVATYEGFWDLAFGTSPVIGDGSQEASKSLLGPLPAYNPANIYTFELNTGLSHPNHLYFGVDDDVRSDNSGAYTIVVSQVASAVPEPSTWALMLIGFVGLGLLACRSPASSGSVRRAASV